MPFTSTPPTVSTTNHSSAQSGMLSDSQVHCVAAQLPEPRRITSSASSNGSEETM